MAELRRPPARSAAEVLGEAQSHTPGAHALAALLPQAARIERPLLRALRLQERLRAADEAELWSSPLVEVRGADGLLLRADVAELLRQRARVALQQGGEGAQRLHRAHGLLLQHHAAAPPLVRLEEEVAWLAMAAADPAQDIQARLNVALAALVRDGRVGVARWAARAVPRLPAVARATRAAWLLSVAAADRVPAAAHALGVPVPPGAGALDLATLAPYLGVAPLGVRRIGDRLELGAVGPGGVAIEVPASQPRFVRVSFGASGSSEAAVAAGALQTLDVGWSDAVSLHAVDGRTWSVPVLGEAENKALKGVLLRVMAIDAQAGSTYRMGTALDADTVLTVPPKAGSTEVAVLSSSSTTRLDPVPHPAVPAGLVLSRHAEVDGVALPVAEAVPQGARVVSYGVDADNRLHPIVGTWDGLDEGVAVVSVRTQAPPEGCLGAPMVVEGRLAGVVVQAVAGGQGSTVASSAAVGAEAPSLQLRVARITPALSAALTATSAAPAEGAVDVELLPAAQGQSVLLSWGPPQDRHHLLFDGGPRATARRIVPRIRQVTGGRLDLVVVSHPDADRVEGVTALLEAGIEVREAWFNGPAQLAGSFAAVASPTVVVDRLLQRLQERGVPVNRAFAGGPAMATAQGPLPTLLLPGGAKLTLAGPTTERLAALASHWQRAAARRSVDAGSAVAPPSARAVEDPSGDKAAVPGDADLYAGAEPGDGEGGPVPDPLRPYGRDRSVANGASLVLLFEHAGQRVLLPGDSWAEPLVDAVRRLAAEQDRSMLFVDLFVLPHGGSRGNVRPELFDVLEAATVAICTDGGRYRHPDAETMLLLAERGHGAPVVFNHRSPHLLTWADGKVRGLPLHTRYPDNDEGIVISLQPGPPRSSLA